MCSSKVQWYTRKKNSILKFDSFFTSFSSFKRPPVTAQLFAMISKIGTEKVQEDQKNAEKECEKNIFWRRVVMGFNQQFRSHYKFANRQLFITFHSSHSHSFSLPLSRTSTRFFLLQFQLKTIWPHYRESIIIIVKLFRSTYKIHSSFRKDSPPKCVWTSS